MTTIRDDIDVWGKKLLGASVIAGNTEAYNHAQALVQELRDMPWAALTLAPDMEIDRTAPDLQARAPEVDTDK